MLLSKSKRAPAIAVSSSEGFCLDGELAATLLIAAMIAGDDDDDKGDEGGRGGSGKEGGLLLLLPCRGRTVFFAWSFVQSNRANCACCGSRCAIGCSAARLAVPALRPFGVSAAQGPLRGRRGT